MTAVTTIMPHVRVAGPPDEREIYRLLSLANSENGLQEPDNAKVTYFVRRFINGDKIPSWDDGARGVIGVVGPVGGRLLGLSVIGLGSFWYTTTRHLEEYVVYVDPDHRRASAGVARALVEWNKGQCSKTGLKMITGILSNHRTEGKVRLYRRMLGTPRGMYFVFPDEFYSEQVSGPGRETGRRIAAVVASSSIAA